MDDMWPQVHNVINGKDPLLDLYCRGSFPLDQSPAEMDLRLSDGVILHRSSER